MSDKSKAAKAAAILAMFSIANSPKIPTSNHKNSFHSSMSEEEKNIKNGLRKFYYGDNFVWASSKKAANKKALKNGYTK